MSNLEVFFCDEGDRSGVDDDLLENLPVTKEEKDVILAIEKVRRRASNESEKVHVHKTDQQFQARAASSLHDLSTNSESSHSKKIGKEPGTGLHQEQISSELSSSREQVNTKEDDLYIEKFFSERDNSKNEARGDHETLYKTDNNVKNTQSTFFSNGSNATSSYFTVEDYRFEASSNNSFSAHVSGIYGRKRPSIRRPSETKTVLTKDSSFITEESFNFGSSGTRSTFSARVGYGGTTNKSFRRSLVYPTDAIPKDKNLPTLSSLHDGGNGNLTELPCFGKTGHRSTKEDGRRGRRLISTASDLSRSSVTS